MRQRQEYKAATGPHGSGGCHPRCGLCALIVLLFSLSRLFFFYFRGRVIPPCRPAQAAPGAGAGRRLQELSDAGRSGCCIPGRLQGVRAAAGGTGPHLTTSHLSSSVTPKARSRCTSYVGSLGPRLDIHGPGTRESPWVEILEPALQGAEQWGSGLGCPLSSSLSLPLLLSCNQTEFFTFVAKYTEQKMCHFNHCKVSSLVAL